MFFGYIDPGTGFTIFSFGPWLVTFFFGIFGFFLLFIKKIVKFFKNFKKKMSIIVASGLILIIFILIWKVMGVKNNLFSKKLIILGFDGLSPEIIEPLMAAEKLPNFSRLKKQGAYQRLATTCPPQSPVAWAALATGQNPGKNGIFDFIIRDPKTYQLSLANSKIEGRGPKRVLKTKGFWNYTSAKKIPTIIITCPLTFPPDKIFGRMLSGMGVPDILGTEGTFTLYTTETRDLDKNTGGQVFRVKKSSSILMHLIGPKVSSFGGGIKNLKVPFKVTLQPDKNSIVIEYENHKSELKAHQWSPWQEVTFSWGLFKKLKGIFKFYPIEIKPELKLYISPINFDPRNPFFTISQPKNYSRDLAQNIGLYHTQGMPMDTWAVNEGHLDETPFLDEVNEILREKEALLDFELNRLKSGVLFSYFELPDIIQHMFWYHLDPKHPIFEKEAVKQNPEIIEKCYQKLDNILGKVMQKIDADDGLIVLSDHGFGTFRRSVHLNSWLRANGFLELKNPLAEFGQELLADIDWSKTKAYALGFGAVYLNLKGREKEGIVTPGQEAELLEQEIIQKLKKWRDEKYGKPIVENVYLRKNFAFGKYQNEAPDLYLGFNIGYRASWQTALGAVPKDLIEDNLKKWSGDHLFDPKLVPGVIFSNFKFTRENPSVYDLTPTILKILGFKEEKFQKFNFDGRALF